MKVRQGFVSNSSSSSYMVIGSLPDLSEKDLRQKSIKEYTDRYDDDFVEYPEDFEPEYSKIEELAKNGKAILAIGSIDWNAQEDLEDFIKILRPYLPKDIEIIWIPD